MIPKPALFAILIFPEKDEYYEMYKKEEKEILEKG
jgi:hypothetical protein